MKRLKSELRRLAEELESLKRRAKALGVFTNDRELLDCPHCGLMEDVAVDGLLITCRAPDLGRDTGLRFRKLNAKCFRCPACGERVKEPPPERGPR